MIWYWAAITQLGADGISDVCFVLTDVLVDDLQVNWSWLI